MSDTVIKVENLSKRYTISHQQERYIALRDVLTDKFRSIGNRRKSVSKEEFWALKDVSFDIKKGDKVGIIGRNGAGKSTLLKLLSRITEPTTGSIALKGRVASLLEVGTGFHPELTGRENIYLNGAILGMSKNEIKSKFDEIVEFAEIEKFLDTPVKRYSSGMYVRLAFSVAAHLQPDILIVDEVLAVGDTQFQKKCLGKMGDVSKEGRTIFFVSHNMTAIKSLCSNCVLLENGKIKEFGSVNKIINQYIDARHSINHINWNSVEAPKNSNVILKSIYIKSKDESLFSSISTESELKLEINYEVINDNSFVGFTLILKDSEDNYVFSSISNKELNFYGRPMKKGLYKTNCLIPSNLLNNGRYSVTLNFFNKGYTDVKILEDVIRFELLDAPYIRGDYYGEYAGTIRPSLNWNTTSI